MNNDLCTCGHTNSEHTHDHGFGRDMDRGPRCTVCPCSSFDWDDSDMHGRCEHCSAPTKAGIFEPRFPLPESAIDGICNEATRDLIRDVAWAIRKFLRDDAAFAKRKAAKK